MIIFCAHACDLDIAHTRQQIDNNPCPKFIQEEVEGGQSCRPGRCARRSDRFYGFEKEKGKIWEDMWAEQKRARVEREMKERERKEAEDKEMREMVEQNMRDAEEQRVRLGKKLKCGEGDQSIL